MSNAELDKQFEEINKRLSILQTKVVCLENELYTKRCD